MKNEVYLYVLSSSCLCPLKMCLTTVYLEIVPSWFSVMLTHVVFMMQCMISFHIHYLKINIHDY